LNLKTFAAHPTGGCSIEWIQGTGAGSVAFSWSALGRDKEASTPIMMLASQRSPNSSLAAAVLGALCTVLQLKRLTALLLVLPAFSVYPLAPIVLLLQIVPASFLWPSE
jgi:hypothetical protein